MKYSLIIPIYKNEASLPRLIDALQMMHHQLNNEMEVVFVVDGSPDRSFEFLKKQMKTFTFPTQLLAHSRNFGSFPAIRTGLLAAKGQYYGIMAADLQEPPQLLISFFKTLSQDDCDVIIGTRQTRKDPFFSSIASKIFWGLYRRLVIREMPEGGVDVFGCNRIFRDHLLQLEESRSSLIALIFWLGFRRKFIGYERQKRQEGKSAWTLSKKLDYMMDSIFSFTNYPIRLLIWLGAMGSFFSAFLGFVTFLSRYYGLIQVPGYAAIIFVILFLGTFNLLGIGLIGSYTWRSYENSKKRPLAVVSLKFQNGLEITDEQAN